MGRELCGLAEDPFPLLLITYENKNIIVTKMKCLFFSTITLYASLILCNTNGNYILGSGLAEDPHPPTLLLLKYQNRNNTVTMGIVVFLFQVMTPCTF